MPNEKRTASQFMITLQDMLAEGYGVSFATTKEGRLVVNMRRIGTSDSISHMLYWKAHEQRRDFIDRDTTVVQTLRAMRTELEP